MFDGVRHEPTSLDVHAEIKKMKNEKAPGEPGAAGEALKALSEEAVEAMCHLLVELWHGWSSPSEWHELILRCLSKKGDLLNPSNLRPAHLSDIAQRPLSTARAQWLHKALEKEGLDMQFGAEKGKRNV